MTFAWEAAQSGGARASTLDVVDHVTIVATTLSGRDVYAGKVASMTSLGRAAGVVAFDAPPGPLRVRVTSENARGVRIDNEEEALDVPDFTATGPQLTTPFLYRGRTARDLQQIRVAELPAPAVTPVFSRTERVLIRFGAYGPAGSRPSVTMRLLNQNGGAIAALPAPSATTGGGLEAELALGPFPPGDYVVEIAAESAGATTKRLVGLRVTG